MKENINIETGVVQVGKRYAQYNAKYSMPSVINVLIETITNVDDSYERLFKDKKIKELKAQNLDDLLIKEELKKVKWHGNCQVFYIRGGKSEPSTIIVKDKAEGISPDSIKEKVNRIGGIHTAGSATRGHNNKGLKDISFVAPVYIFTQKDGMCSSVKIDCTTTMESDEGVGKFEIKKCKYSDRSEKFKNMLNLKEKENGTCVFIRIPSNIEWFSHTTFKKIEENLANNFQLSNMLNNTNHDRNLKLTLFKSLKDKKGTSIEYNPPQGEKIIDETFNLEKFGNEFKCNPKVHLLVFKSDSPLVTAGEDKSTKRYGVEIISGKNCYERNFFGDSNLNNNAMTKQLFGYLRTDLINESLEPFKKASAKSSKLNPTQIVDPNRIVGLDKNHPLTKEINKKAIEFLNKYLKENSSDKINISEKMKKLTKSWANVLYDELSSPTLSNHDENQLMNLPIGQFKFIPPVNTIYIDEEQTLYVYTQEESLNSGNLSGHINSSDTKSEFIKIINNESTCKKNNNGQVYFKFKIQGIKETEKDINISFFYENKHKTQTSVKVKLKKRNFKKNIEFDTNTGIIKVKEAHKKTVSVYAKFPETIDTDTSFDIYFSQPNIVNAKNKILLKPIHNSNYAKGSILVEGKILNGQTTINVTNGDLHASAQIKVISNKEPENPFDIKYKKENYQSDRYIWSAENPNHLWIGCEHKQIKKYLGNLDEFGNYEKFDEIECNVIFAEIISDAVAKRNIQKRYIARLDSDFDAQELLNDISIERNRLLKIFHDPI